MYLLSTQYVRRRSTRAAAPGPRGRPATATAPRVGHAGQPRLRRQGADSALPQVTGDAEQIVTVFGQLQQGLTVGGEVGATDAQSGQVRNMYRNMTTNYGKNMVASCVCTVHSARPPRGWLRAGG